MSKESEGFLAAKKRKKAGTKGKSEEDTVHEILRDLKTERLDFDFDRLADSRSAGKPLPPTVADFTFCAQGVAGALEVKSTKHDFRLSYGDFPQFPRMKRRVCAGGRCLLVVHHSSTNVWRVVLVAEMETITNGSWDLSTAPAFSKEELQSRVLEGIYDNLK